MPSEEEKAELRARAALGGQHVSPDAWLHERQAEEVRRGHVFAEIVKNVHGWCLYQLGMYRGRISDNYPSMEEAIAAAERWMAEDPEHRHVYRP